MARAARLDLLTDLACADIAELVDAFAGDYYHDCLVWFCNNHAPFHCSVCYRRCCSTHCAFTLDRDPVCPDCTLPSSQESDFTASEPASE